MFEIVRKILRTIKLVLIVYLLYALITGVVLFAFQPNFQRQSGEHSPDRFYGENISQDRVVLVEDRLNSGLARINLIENAEETIDISYYLLKDDLAGDIFLATILEAADRGVHVRLLLDGTMNILWTDLHKAVYLFSRHPNIEVKYYEPLDLLRPWTWNNRYHDKFIVVDEKYALVGGRNIGNKYYDPNNSHKVKNDRDILIINTDDIHFENSVIQDIKDYYNGLWNHELVKDPVKSLSTRQKRLAEQKEKQLHSVLKKQRESNPEFFNLQINWLDYSYPAKKVTFIHNPIRRWSKDPLILKDLAALMENAKRSIFIGSPYIVPTNQLLDYVDEDKITAAEINVLTNSLASTPNQLAFSAYDRYREEIASKPNVKLFEFQSQTESLHMKCYIFDNRISAIGSFNLDPRSAFLSTEVMVVIDSEEFSKKLQNRNQEIMENQSLLVREDGSYDPSSPVEEKEAALSKKLLNKLTAIFTWFIEFLI